MEKRVAHYRLAEIRAQMVSVETMHLTLSARRGIRAAGLLLDEALAVVRALTVRRFHKSMTTHGNNRVWQDVYYSDWMGIPLYVKFQQREDGTRLFFVVSFKERD